MIDDRDVLLEGFPEMTACKFIIMFCEHNKCKSYVKVNRIEFEYL